MCVLQLNFFPYKQAFTYVYMKGGPTCKRAASLQCNNAAQNRDILRVSWFFSGITAGFREKKNWLSDIEIKSRSPRLPGAAPLLPTFIFNHLLCLESKSLVAFTTVRYRWSAKLLLFFLFIFLFPWWRWTTSFVRTHSTPSNQHLRDWKGAVRRRHLLYLSFS